MLLGAVLAVGSVPNAAFAAPPKPAPAKKAPKPGKAQEDPKRAEARKAYSEAEAKFQAGDFEGALASYKTANDAVPAAQTLYKIAICLDKLDRSADAIAAYGAFLGANPPATMDAKISEAQARVAELKKKQPVVVKLTSDPPGASVSFDGAPQAGTTPLEVKVTPGHHKFHFSFAGYDAVEKEIDVEGGSADVPLEATLPKSAPVAEAPPPPPPAPPAPVVAEKPAEPPPEKRSNTAAFVVLGIAGAGAIVGTIFGVKALQDKNDYDNGTKTTDKADSVEKNALIADMAFGAALTMGVTGTVLLLTNSSSGGDKAGGSSKAALRVTPMVGAHQAGAWATLRF